jgi:hypothetical protein
MTPHVHRPLIAIAVSAMVVCSPVASKTSSRSVSWCYLAGELDQIVGDPGHRGPATTGAGLLGLQNTSGNLHDTVRFRQKSAVLWTIKLILTI